MTTKELFIEQWTAETQCTLSALKGLPDDISKLDYRPNEKARSANALLSHMLPHAGALVGGIGTMVIREEPVQFEGKAEMIAYFTDQSAQLVEKLRSVDDKTWETGNVDFIINEFKTYTMPMYKMYWMFMNDIIHHRGQLSTYYRAMGTRNPAIYGPSAEDIEDMMAAMASKN